MMTTQNTPKFDDLLAEAKSMGENLGKAKDIQVQFDLKLLHAAFAGSIDMTPDKHGPGLRDGVVLVEAYVKGQNSAVIFDKKAPNQRKTISNADKMIRLGNEGRWGVGQPIGVVNDFLNIRFKLAKDGKKVDDAHNALMRFATAQLKSPSILDDEEMEQYALKSEAEPRTAEEVLEGIRKMATKLMGGKVANCHDVDDSDEVKAIVRQCTKRLTKIAKARAAAVEPEVEVEETEEEAA